MRNLILVISIALLGIFSSSCSKKAGHSKPNVLFIAVDDLRPELKCYSTPEHPVKTITPNIDKLAETSMVFNYAYCNQAVCGASRASLMTGLYPEYTKERTFNVKGWRSRWPQVTTLNQHFKNNGYTTIGTGKIYHRWYGPDADENNWTKIIRVDGKRYVKPESLPKENEKGWILGTATEEADVPDNAYIDGMLAEVGVQQIEELAKSEKPFFLAVGFSKPHLPFNAPTNYWKLYNRDDFSMPPNKGVPPGYPNWAANANAEEIRMYSDIPDNLPFKDFPDDLNKRLIHGYHACVSYTDSNIGKLLAALDNAGISDNTIVVLWGDHGWKLGEHTSWCKHTNFEIDTHVPLFIRYPKIQQAKGTSNAIVELIDLYPTLSELCGLEAPAHLQGKSLVPVLKNSKCKIREYAYSSYPFPLKSAIGHSIRNKDIRYTEWWKEKTDKVMLRVATNLSIDPGETSNLLVSNQELADSLTLVLRRKVLEARKANFQNNANNQLSK